MKIQFSILRNCKTLFNTTIEADNYHNAEESYKEILKDCEIKIKPFDILKGIIINNQNLKSCM